jgi:hypothetical protein
MRLGRFGDEGGIFGGWNYFGLMDQSWWDEGLCRRGCVFEVEGAGRLEVGGRRDERRAAGVSLFPLRMSKGTI